MPYLGLSEVLRLALARPELVSAITKTMDDFEKRTGRRTYIPRHGGVRSPQEQQALVDDRNRQGKTYPVAPANKSRHTFGAAADIHILDDDGTGHELIGHPLYDTLAAIGESHGLVAGRRFQNRDDYHFELKETLDESRRAWADLVGRRLQLVAIVGTVVALTILMRESGHHG